MAFIESRLLDRTPVGAQGGPTWSTRKIPLKSGIVRRNPNRSRPLYRFTIPYAALQQKTVAARLSGELIVAAFNACMGGVDSFRLKDSRDYQATNELLPVVGTGAPQSVQLIKTYTFGTRSIRRLIRKPVTGTVTMTCNGSAQACTVDYTTGIATFTATAAGVLRWSGEFDVPVFFSNDEFLPDTVGHNGAGAVISADVDLEEDLSV